MVFVEQLWPLGVVLCFVFVFFFVENKKYRIYYDGFPSPHITFLEKCQNAVMLLTVNWPHPSLLPPIIG